ncbi:hypothetical protein CLOSCI_02027 [[Clostridium] scindens ATCC 35704]|nr:hypothetical protein CLOSCI_02027 [[Clostridium] scindens ATCC 35704]
MISEESSSDGINKKPDAGKDSEVRLSVFSGIRLLLYGLL